MLLPFETEIAITPIPRAPVEIIAIAASPLIFPFDESRSSRNAAIITTGIATAIGAKFITEAIAKAPNPTCESPSPIIEKRFSTRLTPKSAAQSETKTPTISALTKIGEEKISLKASIKRFTSPHKIRKLAF